jgi:hypothetical protein
MIQSKDTGTRSPPERELKPSRCGCVFDSWARLGSNQRPLACEASAERRGRGADSALEAGSHASSLSAPARRCPGIVRPSSAAAPSWQSVRRTATPASPLTTSGGAARGAGQSGDTRSSGSRIRAEGGGVAWGSDAMVRTRPTVPRLSDPRLASMRETILAALSELRKGTRCGNRTSGRLRLRALA